MPLYVKIIFSFAALAYFGFLSYLSGKHHQRGNDRLNYVETCVQFERGSPSECVAIYIEIEQAIIWANTNE